MTLAGFDQNRVFTGWNPYGCMEKCQQNFNIFVFTQNITDEIEQKIKKNYIILLFWAHIYRSGIVIRIHR